MPVKPVAPALPLPQQFITPAQHQASDQTWWQNALDEHWQLIIDHLLQHNAAIARQAAEVSQAQAALDVLQANRGPDSTLSASASLNQNDNNHSHSLSSVIDARLPLDIFDQLKLTHDAGSYRLVEALAELEQTRLEQIQAYMLAAINAAEARALSGLLDAQIKTATTLIELTELRFSQGLTSSVDVLQQRAQQANLRQQLPAVELTLRLALNRMAELTGQAPDKQQTVPNMPTVNQHFAAASPRDLLDRRPDLIASRAAIAAQNSDYEALLRERLPSIELSAQILLRTLSGNPSALLDIVLDASAPLFDNGRLTAKFTTEAAQLQAAGIDYLQVWLAALRQTEDLLAQQHSLQARLQLSAQTLTVNKQLFEAAKRRYRRGVSDYLPVLSALRTLQQQQRDHLSLQAEQQRVAVQLHTAMGLPPTTKRQHE